VSSFLITIAIQTSDRDFAGLLLLFLLLLVVFYVWSKFRAQACLKQTYEVQKKQLNGQQMNIDATGITGQWEDGNASYQFKWSAFESLIDLPDAFLFLPNSASFVRIPKESLSSDDQLEIKRWGKEARQ
jgi:YcxB-like protein